MTINEIQSIKKQTKEKLPMNKVWDEVTSLINHTKKFKKLITRSSCRSSVINEPD